VYPQGIVDIETNRLGIPIDAQCLGRDMDVSIVPHVMIKAVDGLRQASPAPRRPAALDGARHVAAVRGAGAQRRRRGGQKGALDFLYSGGGAGEKKVALNFLSIHHGYATHV
jgi:hypothetical protein